ncbi:hypothetical protein [Noviherbaspirillum aridicola]|uniref:Uncharacterized protein n=1 Tax=Noviherbaspirillum aridicola TaxID=2849687 RepID=A0ABQ4Q1Q5_9BURK|nr:hypothetical protein [Noviherbaspirillum aridicola]GIZ51117.1 hypothetical protein NCCP691_11310 [Noviherbaspirillum aridicola]
MAFTWETPKGVWQEDENGSFGLSRSKDFGEIAWSPEATGRAADIAQLIGASVPTQCSCAPIFPDDFAHCPECGKPLRNAASNAKPAPEWWGPCGDHSLSELAPKGLPITAVNLDSIVRGRTAGQSTGRPDTTMLSPPLAPCVFASSRFGLLADRLIALSFEQNALQYWDPHEKQWLRIAADGDAAGLSFTRSAYYWIRPAVPETGEIALVPTDSGLYRLFLNPVTASYLTRPVWEKPLVSAPAQVQQHTACLYKDSDGVRLWTAKARAPQPQVYPCAGGQLPDNGWSRPITLNGQVIWLHQRGHLVWKPGAEPQWLPWRADWEPRFSFGGATQSRDGRLWLMGQNEQGFTYVQLGVPDGPSTVTDGARLGFGSFVFRLGHQVLEDPWDAGTVEDENDAHALVVPVLLSQSGDRRKRTGLVLRYDHFVGTAAAMLDGREERDAKLQWIGDQIITLDRARISTPLELSAFVHEDHLWLHHPDWREMRGWRLNGGGK